MSSSAESLYSPEALRSSIEAGDIQSGKRMALACLQDKEATADALAVSATILLWSGMSAEADLALDRAMKLNSESASVWASKADSDAFNARLESCQEAAASASRYMDQPDTFVCCRLASAYQCVGLKEKMWEIVDVWVSADPVSPYPLLEQINFLIGEGRFSDADQLLDELLVRFPEHPKVLFVRGRRLMRERQVQDAVAHMESALQNMPGSAFSMAELANLLAMMNQFDKAEVYANRALEISSAATLAYSALSKVAVHKGDNKAASALEKQAMECIPFLRWQMLQGQTAALMGKGDWKGVIRIAKQVLESAPSPMTKAQAAEQLVRAYTFVGNFAEAEAYLETLKGFSRNIVGDYEVEAALYLKKNDSEKALAVLREGWAKFPTSGTMAGQLIETLHPLQYEDEIDHVLDYFHQNLPQMAIDLIALITALDTIGRKQEAEFFADYGQKAFPEADEMKFLKAMSLMQEGNFAEADQLAKELRGVWAPHGKMIRRGGCFMRLFFLILSVLLLPLRLVFSLIKKR